MSPLAKPGDTIEQSYCRERTEVEHEGVEMRRLLRMMDQGAVQIRLNPDPKRVFHID